jgi:hypothetical protein
VHSPKFSKTFRGTFPVPFNFGLEISKLLVEWKTPRDAFWELIGVFNNANAIRVENK